MIAAMSSSEGPFGPGLPRVPTEENRRRYFLSTSALWNRNNVAGLRRGGELGDAPGTDKQRSQSERESIHCGQRGRAPIATVADDQLML